MKKSQKILLIIFSIMLLFLITHFENLNAVVANNSSGNSYVSAVSVKETIDGTAPFDNDNSAGNDSSDSNGIIRSFDSIMYTIEYITALEEGVDAVSEGYLDIEFILPYTKDIATFNLDAMAWIIDPVITENTNGTQTLTGKRHLQNTTTSNAIPGQGTLSVGITVQAATNGTVIQPTFKFKMESSNKEQIIQPSKITTSAALKFNIKLAKASSLNYLSYFNMSTGQEEDNNLNGALYGRMQNYGITLQLHNDNA